MIELLHTKSWNIIETKVGRKNVEEDNERRLKNRRFGAPKSKIDN